MPLARSKSHLRNATTFALSTLVLAAVACGGDDDGDGASISPAGSTSATSPTGTGSAASPAPDAVALDQLQGRIVFISTRSGNQDVWVMNADGSEQRNLTESTETEAFPAWSPDGSQIAYQQDFDIYVMNADGSGKRLVVPNGSGPSWSVDGSRLAFAQTATQGTRIDIAVIEVEGGDVTMLTDTPEASEAYVAYSPDGERLAFFSDQDAAPGIYVMDAGGGDVQAVTNTGTFDFYPAWSPDGSKIVFAHPRGGVQSLVVTAPDGSSRTELSGENTFDSFPTWSPDGCCIAFLSTRSGQSDVWVFRSDGSGARQITTDPAVDGDFGIDWTE